MESAGQFSRQTGRTRPTAVQHQQLPQPPRDERRGGRRAGFGNALTSDEPANGGANAAAAKGKSTSGTATPRIDEPEETNEMQTELLERVATMVEYSETKLSSFRHAIRSYKNNEAPARDLVDTVYSVLNRDSEDTLRVVKRIAETMRGDDDKVRGILTALNAWKIDVSRGRVSRTTCFRVQGLMFGGPVFLHSDKTNSPPWPGLRPHRSRLVRGIRASPRAKFSMRKRPLEQPVPPARYGTGSNVRRLRCPPRDLLRPSLQRARRR